MPGLVHGDYGPQNLLLDPESLEVVAVLDWEFAHDGDRVEDLAWAEWIVRLHHRDAVQYLPSLFEEYGQRPDWALRQAVMMQRCARRRSFGSAVPVRVDGRGIKRGANCGRSGCVEQLRHDRL